MGYVYDTEVIHGSTKDNYNSFILNGFTYYTTKTGITKRKQGNEKAVKITENEYKIAWEKYYNLFH